MDHYTMTTSSNHDHEHDHDHPPSPIHGDVLEAILSHVPLIHLIPASHVSKTWTDVVSTTLRTSTTYKPWLILHTQSYRHPNHTTTHAYDPDSNSWIQIRCSSPELKFDSTLRSSHSNLLYMITSSKLSFSSDPIHLTWHHIMSPKVTRIDPIVAVVGCYVIVAGGSFEFESDPLAVEVYDLQSQNWTKTEPLPEYFITSASSMWVSVASDNNNNILYVMEKSSGVTYLFYPSTNTWTGPYHLYLDDQYDPNGANGHGRVFYSVIGFCGTRLILIGLLGVPEDVVGVKVWEVDCCTFNINEMGEMPVDMVERLRSWDTEVWSVDVAMSGDMVYMCFCSRSDEVVVCEFVGGGGGGCRWRCVVNRVVECGGVVDNVVLTCSMVGVEELQRATKLKNRRFVVKR